MTTADLGTNNYRWPDGTAREGTVAAIHDRVFNKFFEVWLQIADAHPGLLMSVENPVGWFQHMPAVTSLLRRDHSWQLCETHYCRAADEELDKFMTWSKKPTHLLVKNIPSGYRLPQCEHKCRYRFPQGSGKEKFHLKAVRIDAKSIEGQTRLLDWHRDAIPQGLFQTLWCAHLEHSTQLDVQSHYSHNTSKRVRIFNPNQKI